LVHEWAGDKLLAKVLISTTPPTRLLRSFPLIQGETIESLEWSSTHWCMPAVTWHYVGNAGIDRLTQGERTLRNDTTFEEPLRFSDYFRRFVEPQIRAGNGALPSWDNLSADWVQNEEEAVNHAYTSATACESFCRSLDECLQWFWAPGFCKGGKVPRLGWAIQNRPSLGSAEDRIEKLDASEVEGALSGWMMEWVEAYATALDEKCQETRLWITENDD
jgi:hypothetical protein